MTKNNATAVTEQAPNGGVAHAAETPERTGGADSAALLKQLAAEFPRSQISWRAQSVSTKDPENPKALALAYIDARDVMNRLDDVCGAAGWQCEYPHASGKTICSIGIKIDGEWIWKADGAGDSDIEAEKGAISDAFKRAAVKWGIGRYLYELDSPWVPCELYNGKWSKWKGDPWDSVRGQKAAPKQSAAKPPKSEVFKTKAARDKYEMRVVELMEACPDIGELKAVWEDEYLAKLNELRQSENEDDQQSYAHLLRMKDVVKLAIMAVAKHD